MSNKGAPRVRGTRAQWAEEEADRELTEMI